MSILNIIFFLKEKIILFLTHTFFLKSHGQNEVGSSERGYNITMRQTNF